MNYKDFFKKYKNPSKKGFTLVEVVAVIVILAIVSGATLSVFIMVHQITRDAKTITINQYNTTQLESLIRHEFQAASNIDIMTLDLINGTYKSKVLEDDEFIIYDPTLKQVSFIRADKYKSFKDATGAYHTIFTISDVKKMTISVSPMNNQSSTAGQPYKLFYKIETSKYQYSGGLVLNNTSESKDDSMVNCRSIPELNTTSPSLVWYKPDPNPDGTEVVNKDNTYVVYFHRNKAKDEVDP